MKPKILSLARAFKPERVYVFADIVDGNLPKPTVGQSFPIPVLHETVIFTFGKKLTILAKAIENDIILQGYVGTKTIKTSLTAKQQLSVDKSALMLASEFVHATFFLVGQASASGPREAVKKLKEVWERKGDTIKFTRLRNPTFGTGKPLDAIYRKREHAVRGHWRNLKSGKRVWVRAHNRGDPSLGHVTSVFTID